MKLRWLRYVGLFLLVVVLLIGAGVYNYASGAADAQAVAVAQMAQPNVMIARNGTISFVPSGTLRDIGFIFYQGGLVEEAAYAPLLQQIAAAGYPVFTPAMPINLAVVAPDRAQRIIDDHPEIERWVIGGHSLGGSMAADFAFNNPELIDGLVMIASQPGESADLSQSALPVVSIYGSKDGLMTPRRVQRSSSLLPADTAFIEITGGNHAQFGDYGVQERDGVATISAETQWQQTSDAILNFLNNLKPIDT